MLSSPQDLAASLRASTADFQATTAPHRRGRPVRRRVPDLQHAVDDRLASGSARSACFARPGPRRAPGHALRARPGAGPRRRRRRSSASSSGRSWRRDGRLRRDRRIGHRWTARLCRSSLVVALLVGRRGDARGRPRAAPGAPAGSSRSRRSRRGSTCPPPGLPGCAGWPRCSSRSPRRRPRPAAVGRARRRRAGPPDLRRPARRHAPHPVPAAGHGPGRRRAVRAASAGRGAAGPERGQSRPEPDDADARRPDHRAGDDRRAGRGRPERPGGRRRLDRRRRPGRARPDVDPAGRRRRRASSGDIRRPCRTWPGSARSRRSTSPSTARGPMPRRSSAPTWPPTAGSRSWRATGRRRWPAIDAGGSAILPAALADAAGRHRRRRR